MAGISNPRQIEVNIVGGSTFGRYPKISDEKTVNMFISDGWLVNYAGFEKKNNITPGIGRGIFNSIRGGFLIAVIRDAVYKINAALIATQIGTIGTTTGDVTIDENLSSQICIVDGDKAYIYNYDNSTFTQQTLTFLGNPILPNYVTYHNTFFLFGSSKTSINSQNWYAFDRDTDTTIKLNTQFSLQTKPDSAIAVVRLPGKGNNVLVLGSTVAEVWTQIGGKENYRRVQSFNIDNGCVAASTIATSDEWVIFLAKNENNSPYILLTDGGSSKRISTDGIDYLLSTLRFPEQSTGFLYRQDGHLFYQLTFYNPEDNLSLIYDFATQMFFHVTDEKLNFHPARSIVFFNQSTYFVSLNDGSLYKMGTNYITYDYSTAVDATLYEIPRIRVCKTIRGEDSAVFRVGEFSFTIEQGVFQDSPPVPSQVDMSFSKNGNQSFSNVVSKTLNTVGIYKNRLRWFRMGSCNEFTIQLRFYGYQRFVCNNGILTLY